MSWAYFHLVINHFPISGVIIGTLLLFSGVAFKNQGVKISGLGTVVFAALLAILAYITGDPARNAVNGIPDVAQILVSRHENMASIAMFLLIPSGLMAALTLYSIWKKEKSIQFLIMITLVLSLISSAALVYVGHTGGQIRHNEFRTETTKQYIIDHENDLKDEY